MTRVEFLVRFYKEMEADNFVVVSKVRWHYNLQFGKLSY